MSLPAPDVVLHPESSPADPMSKRPRNAETQMCLTIWPSLSTADGNARAMGWFRSGLALEKQPDTRHRILAAIERAPGEGADALRVVE